MPSSFKYFHSGNPRIFCESQNLRNVSVWSKRLLYGAQRAGWMPFPALYNHELFYIRWQPRGVGTTLALVPMRQPGHRRWHDLPEGTWPWAAGAASKPVQPPGMRARPRWADAHARSKAALSRPAGALPGSGDHKNDAYRLLSRG